MQTAGLLQGTHGWNCRIGSSSHGYFLAWLCMYSRENHNQNLSLLFSQQSPRALPRFRRNQAHWTLCSAIQHGHEKMGNALNGDSANKLLCCGLPWRFPAAENRIAKKRLRSFHTTHGGTTCHGFPGGHAVPNV